MHMTVNTTIPPSKRPLAVIVKGNPKYINMPAVKAMADHFYGEIKQLLEAKGYRVLFNVGRAYTSPNPKAAVWIGHSRGIDRLQFAPPHVRTIALQTQDHVNTYASNDVRGVDPLHYELSSADRSAIAALPDAAKPSSK